MSFHSACFTQHDSLGLIYAPTTVLYDGATAPWGVYDQLGREVRTLRVAAGQSTIDLSDLAPGTYLIGPLNGPKQRLSRMQ